ncbi:hypothetical protein ACSS6W_008744 [Trichoderma asperelloides]
MSPYLTGLASASLSQTFPSTCFVFAFASFVMCLFSRSSTRSSGSSTMTTSTEKESGIQNVDIDRPNQRYYVNPDESDIPRFTGTGSYVGLTLK